MQKTWVLLSHLIQSSFI